MLSLFKKLNRGAVLTVILLLAVVIYLITLAAVQSGEKPEIEKICRDYISLETEYALLPQDYRAGNEIMPEEELQSYLAEMEAAITPYYIVNDRIRQLALERLEGRLIDQAEGWDRILSYEKNITDFYSFSFSGSEVTVLIKTQSIIERPDNPVSKAAGGRVAGETRDTVVLQKNGDQWMVVYAAINEPVSMYR